MTAKVTAKASMSAGLDAVHSANEHGPALHVALWVAQAVLALAFGIAGWMKLMLPIATLVNRLPWVTDTPVGMVRFIGAAELAGALGMLLPSLTRVAPSLTPLAASGLTTVMALAAALHVYRGEVGLLFWPALLGTLASFVAWGRLRHAPIAPRTFGGDS
jgi:putative oxidoreductase